MNTLFRLSLGVLGSFMRIAVIGRGLMALLGFAIVLAWVVVQVVSLVPR